MLLARLASRSRLGLALRSSQRLFTRTLRFAPTPEQQQVVELSKSHNLVISACPGAGKTATIEAIVDAHPDTPIAVFTFSRALQQDLKKRLARYDLVDVFTCHSLASHLFNKPIMNDTLLLKNRPLEYLPEDKLDKPYQMIIMDEVQDIDGNLYWVACILFKLLCERGLMPRIVCLGDPRQAIYQFRGACSLFLELAPRIFEVYSFDPWSHRTFSRSMRCSETNAAFYNDVCWNDESQMFSGSGIGPRPLYVVADLDDTEKLYDTLLPIIREYGEDNCAILSPFLRNNRKLSTFANRLSFRAKIPMVVSLNDQDENVHGDEDITRGKLSISTFHGFKGLERSLVILFGFDESYFSHLGKNDPRNRCPNPVYVALTRAKHQLVIVQSHRKGPMPFFNMLYLRDRVDFINLSSPDADITDLLQSQPQSGPPSFKSKPLPLSISVSNIARFNRASCLNELASAYLECIHVTEPGDDIGGPSKVLTNRRKNMWEPVSDINGHLVLTAFKELVESAIRERGREPVERDTFQRIPSERVVELTRQAVYESARRSGYFAQRYA